MYSFVHKNKKFVAGVIGIVSLSFLLWLFFAGDFGGITKMSGGCVAEVNGACVTLRDYRRELLRYGDFLQNKDMEKVIKDQVLENLIVQEMLYARAKDLGFVPSDQEVVEIIKSDPSFQEGGVFSHSKYKESLSRLGLEVGEYEEYIKKLLSIQKLLSLVGNGAYLTPQEERINLLAHSITLTGKLYVISPENLQVEVKREEIVDFYEKNKELFKKSPSRVIRIWKEKERQKATQIYQSLKEGRELGNFQELKLPEQRGEIPPELAEEADRLGSNNRLTLTKAGDEYVILFFVREEQEGYKSLEEVIKDIEQTLKERKTAQQLKPFAEKAKEDLKQGKPVPYKPIAFSQTPASQLPSMMKIEDQDLFEIMLSNEKVFGPYPLLKVYAVLVVENREKRELSEEQKKSLIRDISSLKRDATINYYIQNLRKKAKVRINRELIGG
ncbi:SurA N-terminal domain-containing protein [Thermocrinis sp.]